MILPIITYGNPILRKHKHLIKEKSKELDDLIDNMFDTLYNAEGVGLTAHQIGNPLSLFIVDYDNGKENLKEVFINSEITEYLGDDVFHSESCLSIPDIKEDVKRPSIIKIKYLDKDFNHKEIIYENNLARIIQHEYDHTNGILFIDKLLPLKKKIISNKLKAIMKKKFSVHYRTK